MNRICLSTVKKGSLTVEAAFALPLFFLTVISMISLMGIYGTFVREMVSLQQRAEQIAMSRIYTEGENSTPVCLYSTVKAELPFIPFHTGTPRVRVAARVRPWTGRSSNTPSEGNSMNGLLYYVSDYQSVYHTSSACSYLSLQIVAIDAGSIPSAKNDSGKHYYPCENCIGNGITESVVYVTENGEHYHNSPECTGLKRSIHLVDAGQLSGLHLCSRCNRRGTHS